MSATWGVLSVLPGSVLPPHVQCHDLADVLDQLAMQVRAADLILAGTPELTALSQVEDQILEGWQKIQSLPHYDPPQCVREQHDKIIQYRKKRSEQAKQKCSK
jgi:hypothetical protein